MFREKKEKKLVPPPKIELTDQDVVEAMKQIPGYLDITPGDFREVYRIAFEQALARLSRAVTAREIMTRDVAYVTREAPLAEVAEIMGQRGISGVPVLAEGRVVGIISEKDLLTRMGIKAPENFMTLVATCLKSKKCLALPMKMKRAADIMSSPAITVGEDTPVLEIARLLTEKAINRVPVTDQAGRLLGLVSRGDLVRAYLQGARP